MVQKSEIRLGQLLIQKKWCALSEVNEALLKQSKLRTTSEKRPLGQLLMESGVLDEETLREALNELGVLKLYCPFCRVEYPMDSYQRGSTHKCTRCMELLILAEAESPVNPVESSPIEAMAPASAAELAERAAPSPEAPAHGSGASRGSRGENPESSPEAERDSYIGKVFGGCQILDKVAHGGMGVVYKARQLNLGRTVAVKILSGELARDSTFVRRFIQEARSAAQLSHGNIVHINDVGEYQGVFYFVMEYVDGNNLKELLQTEEVLGVPRVLEIITQVCHALRHSHSRGIIHRDIKPENIMLTREGVVKLADLGLAKRVSAENNLGLTHAGSILGTPFYMAPEQAKDFSSVDHRSDIYSLGVTMYRALTGKVPYDGRSPIEVMIKAVEGRRVPIGELREEVPNEVEKIVDKMMHKQPEKRYQQVEDLLVDLDRVGSLANT
jgi:predicted Ser/Thr protein kinase